MTKTTRGQRLQRAAGMALVLAAAYGCGAGGDAPAGDAPEAGTPPASAPGANAPGANTPGDSSMSDALDAGEGPAAPADPSTTPSGADDGASAWTVQDTRVDRDGAGLAQLMAVRSARHDGFDRVVLEFEGTAVPGYSVAYIDRPVRQCGSGNAVPVDGDGWLQIELTPARAHTEAGRATITERSRRPGLVNIRQLELTCDFEGHVVWVAGVGSPTPYRVLELRSPARLIIDVHHSGGAR